MDKPKIRVILSEGWVGPRGAKDLCDDRGSAPGFVRRSFAPTPAPTLSLRMTVGWSWALDNELRNAANPHKHWEEARGGGRGRERRIAAQSWALRRDACGLRARGGSVCDADHMAGHALRALAGTREAAFA